MICLTRSSKKHTNTEDPCLPIRSVVDSLYVRKTKLKVRGAEAIYSNWISIHHSSALLRDEAKEIGL